MRNGMLTLMAGILFITSIYAAERTLNVYKTNHTIHQIVLDSLDSVSVDQSTNLLLIHRLNGSVDKISLTEIDSMNYSTGTYVLPTIGITSSNYDYKSSLQGRGVCNVNISDDGGCEITERGICWSTNENPTIDDYVFTAGSGNGKFLGMTSKLGFGKTYYMRAYAINCKGIAYSEQAEIVTFTGNVTYTLDVDPEAMPTEYALLKEALDSACYFYNRYTTFEANIYVYYSSGIPTAQASYHGSIGYGPNTTYMWVGTTMHEMAHYFGSGTTNTWKNQLNNGVWQGTIAKNLCLQLTGDPLKGDGTHYWPTGINYRDEVDSVTDLINHAKIVQAMIVEDAGLPDSW